MKIQIKVLNKEFYAANKWSTSYFDLPNYQTFGSAAIDLQCTEDITVKRGSSTIIPTGLAIWIGGANKDIAGLIVPRSGLGSKGLILANTIGVIDEDYQGELKIAVWNRTQDTDITLKAGDRIAQLLFVPALKAEWVITEEFTDETKRGFGGFGHTGD